ncbi:MAG: DUF4105 domain-containing protein [Lysobacter sp.]
MHDVGASSSANAERNLIRRCLLLAALWLLSASALAAPRIAMVTMQPGEIFWERFGHDAILVVDPEADTATSYNFGFFDPSEPDFIARFIRGEMRYQLAALPFEQDMSLYQHEGRGVSLQWLDLDDMQARALADALAVNARPEHAHYRYDYFLDNCSTRVRDAIDRTLGGTLRPQLEGRSQGNTFRSEALRLVSPVPWMWVGFDLALGPDADRVQPVWADAFVPMRLAAALRESRNTSGRPLVIEERVLLPHRLAPEPEASPTRWWAWGLAGIAIAAAFGWLGRRRPRVLAAIALPFWLLSGVIGALLLFAWIFTEHRIIWGNHNLLLLHPLSWLLLPGGWSVMRGRNPGAWFDTLLIAPVALAGAALFFYWLPILPQRNAHWIALLLPLHLGLLLGFRRR